VINAIEEQTENVFGKKVKDPIVKATTNQIVLGEKEFNQVDEEINKYIKLLNATKAHFETHFKKKES
jgi:hypothetical protein